MPNKICQKFLYHLQLDSKVPKFHSFLIMASSYKVFKRKVEEVLPVTNFWNSLGATHFGSRWMENLYQHQSNPSVPDDRCEGSLRCPQLYPVVQFLVRKITGVTIGVGINSENRSKHRRALWLWTNYLVSLSLHSLTENTDYATLCLWKSTDAIHTYKHLG